LERAFKGIWIPKEVWLSKDLTLQEKVFLVEIDSLDNESGCYASNKYFAEFFGLSKNRCSEVIKSLEKKKLITIKYIRDEGKKSIKKRVMRVVDKSNRGIRNVEGGYSENLEENNTLSNNTKKILSYLNSKADKNFKHTSKKTKDLIKARFNEGFTVKDFYKVIDIKVAEWKDDPKMEKYLRPETLFSNKFEGYLNQKHKESEEDKLLQQIREIRGDD